MTRTDPPHGPVDRFLDATAGRLVGPAFGAGSFVRRARVFHPRGRTFAVTVDVPGDDRCEGTVFGERGTHHGLLRLSRRRGRARAAARPARPRAAPRPPRRAPRTSC